MLLYKHMTVGHCGDLDTLYSQCFQLRTLFVEITFYIIHPHIFHPFVWLFILPCFSIRMLCVNFLCMNYYYMLFKTFIFKCILTSTCHIIFKLKRYSVTGKTFQLCVFLICWNMHHSSHSYFCHKVKVKLSQTN